jgi:DNA-binding NarL/FixJ family response regulator
MGREARGIYDRGRYQHSRDLEGIQVDESAVPRTNGPIRALVAEDFLHMQEALVACLQDIPNVQVVATAFNGREALEKVQQMRPELAIVDLQMSVMNGFQLLAKLRQLYPGMQLVAISGHQSPTIEEEALKAGANAFVSKSQLPYSLISTVQKLLAN